MTTRIKANCSKCTQKRTCESCGALLCHPGDGPPFKEPKDTEDLRRDEYIKIISKINTYSGYVFSVFVGHDQYRECCTTGHYHTSEGCYCPECFIELHKNNRALIQERENIEGEKKIVRKSIQRKPKSEKILRENFIEPSLFDLK